MAKRKQGRSFPRSSRRSRSGSAPVTLSVLAALAGGVWFLLGELGVVPPLPGGPYMPGAESASSPSTPATTSADADPAPAPATGEGGLSGAASVIDADTLDIHGLRIRLVGIDAPESGQKCRDPSGALYRCGSAAANALDQWINRNPVTCVSEGKDRYQRALGLCAVRGESVQQWLVTNGHAVAYRAYSMDFVPAEEKARAAKAGIWAGEFVMPDQWRKGVRLEGEPAPKS